MASSEAHRKAVAKYSKANYSQVRIYQSTRQAIDQHTSASGESLASLIDRAVKHQIAIDQAEADL